MLRGDIRPVKSAFESAFKSAFKSVFESAFEFLSPLEFCSA